MWGIRSHVFRRVRYVQHATVSRQLILPVRAVIATLRWASAVIGHKIMELLCVQYCGECFGIVPFRHPSHESADRPYYYYHYDVPARMRVSNSEWTD